MSDSYTDEIYQETEPTAPAVTFGGNGHHAQATPPEPDTPPDELHQAMDTDLPTIITNNRHLRDVTQDAMAALIISNQPPKFFMRSGCIVRMRVDERKRPVIENITESILRSRLARIANFIVIHKSKDDILITRPVDPPLDVVRDIQALGTWDFPALEAVTECPTLRPDGTVIDNPGYDPATLLYYQPSPELTFANIPDQPTKDAVDRALALLYSVIGEFPYSDQACRANAYALFLTPFVSAAIRGQKPLACIDAPQAGTGKTLLASVVSLAATGRDAAMMTAPRDSDEWRKKITAALYTGATVITIDNLSGTLYSGDLSAALTASTWADRILGKSETIYLPQRATWIATGNNIRLAGDLPRRCYWIRLDAQTSRPWQREGFQHAELLDWVSIHRGEIIAAGLTLIRSWLAAGRQPYKSGAKIGGFSDWVNVVGGILENAGINGFLDNLEDMYQNADDESPQWETFLLELNKRYTAEVTVSEICRAIESTPELVDFVPSTLDAPIDNQGKLKTGFKRQLGNAFKQHNGTRYGDEHVYIQKAGSTRDKVAKWVIHRGVAGSRGVTSSQGPDEKSNNNIYSKQTTTETDPADPADPARASADGAQESEVDINTRINKWLNEPWVK